jgi:hypothetical protein
MSARVDAGPAPRVTVVGDTLLDVDWAGDVEAEAVAFALTRPAGCEVRELVVTPPDESSWP